MVNIQEVLARLNITLGMGEHVDLMTDNEGYWSADLEDYSDPQQHSIVRIQNKTTWHKIKQEY